MERKEPTGIPAIWAMASPAVAYPIVLIMACFGTVMGIDAQICGEIREAKTPARNRAVKRDQNPHAKPHKPVKSVKPMDPVRIMRLRSMRSDSGPAMSAKTAYPKAYAETNHPDCSVVVLNSLLSSGSRGAVRKVSVPMTKRVLNETSRMVASEF